MNMKIINEIFTFIIEVLNVGDINLIIRYPTVKNFANLKNTKL